MSGRRMSNLTDEQLLELRRLRSAGHTWEYIARSLGMNKSTLRAKMMRYQLFMPGERVSVPRLAWTDAMDTTLRELVDRSVPYWVIADVIGVNMKSIGKRVRALGLVLKPIYGRPKDDMPDWRHYKCMRREGSTRAAAMWRMCGYVMPR